MISEIVVPDPQPSFKQMKGGVVPCDLIVDNYGVEYPCHAVVVCAVCPKILEHRSAANGSRVILNLPDKIGLIGKIIDFCYGYDFVINPQNCDLCFLIASKLELQVLIDKSKEVMESQLTKTNVCQTLMFFNRYHVDYSMHIQFIKEHFSEMIGINDMYNLPIPVLDEIANSEALGSGNEDTIAVWVKNVIQNRGKDAAHLVDSLHLEKVSKDVLLELCSTQPLEAKDVLDKSKEQEKHPKPERVYRLTNAELEQLTQTGKTTSIEPPEKPSAEGIIYNIMNKMGGVVHIAVSSCHYKYFDPQNLLKLDNYHNIWYSTDKPDQWIMWDFSPYMISIKKYYLRTSGCKFNEGHLQSWVLLGSNDKQKWVEIDKRMDCDELNGGYKAAMFDSHCQSFFRFFKLQQIGHNFRYDYSMQLSCFECYGNILQK